MKLKTSYNMLIRIVIASDGENTSCRYLYVLTTMLNGRTHALLISNRDKAWNAHSSFFG